MAKLGKYSANEGASLEAASEWTVSTVLDISSAAVAEKLLGERTQYLTLYADLACYYLFDLITGDNNSATNDPVLPATTLTRIKVPRGLGNTIYFHVTPTSSAGSKGVRLVEE